MVSMGCLTAWTLDVPGGHQLLQTGAALQCVAAAVIPCFATTRRVNTIRANRREARTTALR
jgi:CDP-diacylglycerol--serine O-phosphatidyltransferase